MRRTWAPELGAAALAALWGLSAGAVTPRDGGATDPESTGALLVLLQGERLQEIRAAAEASGATITHSLPIISAIGARMTPAQLEQVRVRPFVERVIDDLAYRPVPDIEDDDSCPLASALHLTWDNATAQWQLFNKSRNPLALQKVSLSWPESLGKLQTLTLDGEAPTDAGLLPARNRMELSVSGWELAASGTAALTMRFAAAPESAATYELQNSIELDISASADCGTQLVPSYPAPLADTYYPTVSGAALLQRHGVTGAGVAVAVLDSGLWEEPQALRLNTQGAPRIRARFDAVAGEEVAIAPDESGHGTHMTSIIADSRPVQRGNSAGEPSYRGVAPDVDLIVVKAFDSTGEAGFLDLVRGIQWVVDNRERLNIRVLNLSFASRPRWPYWDDPVNQALMRAWEAGIVIIAAAGNEGPDPMTVGSPGNLPYLITVGAVTDSWTEADRLDDYLPDFSSRGPTPTGHIKPDVVAYGGHIAGLMRPRATLAQEFPEYFLGSETFVMTGSSQAAAVVSGLAALLIQAEPGVSNNDIKCMFMSSAEPAISPDGRLAYSPFLQGSGLVNVSRAITVGDRGCGNSDLSLQDDIARVDRFMGPAIFHDDGTPPTLPGQESLISPLQPEKGHSSTRRWGAAAHLERLDDPSRRSAFDWLSQHLADQQKIRTLADKGS